MAEAAPREEETKKKERKKPGKAVFLGGGLVALIATGYALSLVAAPKAADDAPFQGPFVVDLSSEQLQVNLAKDGGKRFLSMSLKAEVYAYEPSYPTDRLSDPLYKATLKDALIRVSTQKSKDDLETNVGKDMFKEELREAVEPILFPVHVGNDRTPYEGDPKSGLRPGESCRLSTYREGFHSGVLKLDAARHTIALGDGAPVTYEAGEEDLKVPDAKGRFVYVDVSRVQDGFTGEVHAGTFGRVKNILFDSIIVQ